MAAAIGVSTAQLDDMMKKGKVLSEDALPKFAAMLNTVTRGGNFDSLQMSMNRLKNTWTELVNSSGFEGFYKSIVDTANKALGYFQTDFGPKLKGIFAGIFAGIGAIRFTRWLPNFRDTVAKDIASIRQEYKAANTEAMKLYKGFNFGGGLSNVAVGARNSSYVKYDTNDFYQRRASLLANRSLNPTDFSTQYKKLYDDTKKLTSEVYRYNEALLATEKLRRKAGMTPLISKAEIKNIKAYNAELSKFRTQFSPKTLPVNETTRGFAVLGGVLKNIGLSLATMGAQVAVALAVGMIVKAIDKWRELNKAIKENAKLFENYSEDVKASNVEVEKNANILMSHLNIIRNTNNSLKARENSLKEINKLTGSKFTTDALDKTKQAYQDIVKEVHRWIEATRLQAKVQVYATKAAEAEAQHESMDQKFHAAAAEAKAFEEQANAPFTADWTREYLKSKAIAKKQEAKAYLTAMVEYGKIMRDAKGKLDELNVEITDAILGEGGNTQPGGGTLKGIPKIMEDYKNAVNELNASLSQGIITQADYEKQLDKLIIDTWHKAAKTGKLGIKEIVAKADKGATLTAMEKWYYDIFIAAGKAAQRALVSDYIKELDDELKKLSDRYDKANQSDIKALNSKMPDFKPRDTTFDYKKDRSEILEEEIEAERRWASELKEAIDEIKGSYENINDAGADVIDKLHKMTAAMNRAEASADNLEAAMKFQKIKEDIEDLEKQIRSAFASGIKGLASDMDRVVKGMESIRDTMDNADASAWDKFMVVFNEIAQIADLVVGVINTFNAIQEASAKLAGAELAQNAALIEMQQKKVNLERELFIWKSKNAGLTDVAIAKEISEAVASRTNASAKASEAVAGATASGAKLAFPWNLAAIAVGVATVLAALTGGKNIKFANGGIVGGNSYSGDKQLARVNSGELILNRGQQAKLFKMINNGGVGGNVEFKIRGCDLIGAINNEQSRRKG